MNMPTAPPRASSTAVEAMRDITQWIGDSALDGPAIAADSAVATDINQFLLGKTVSLHLHVFLERKKQSARNADGYPSEKSDVSKSVNKDCYLCIQPGGEPTTAQAPFSPVLAPKTNQDRTTNGLNP